MSFVCAKQAGGYLAAYVKRAHIQFLLYYGAKIHRPSAPSLNLSSWYMLAHFGTPVLSLTKIKAHTRD